jgi:hypothetical protein
MVKLILRHDQPTSQFSNDRHCREFGEYPRSDEYRRDLNQ